MSSSFYIIDDDPAVRRILKDIIQEHIEDAAIFQNDDPWMAIQDILKLKPDIILLDLLMPEIDGLEVASQLKTKGYSGKVIMISEVTSKDIIEKAYAQNVEYFISKPINVTEVISIIRRTLELIQLKAYIRIVHRPEERVTDSVINTDADYIVNEKKFNDILQDLGIKGESGTAELLEAIKLLIHLKKTDVPKFQSIQLMEIYEILQHTMKNEYREDISVKGIEQRLRRLTASAMENIAHIGIEDFSHYRFEKYATSLFHFKSVKQEMDFYRKLGLTRGKVDVRRFIEGIIEVIE